MKDLESYSREELVKYLRFTAGLALAVDGLWFVAAEKVKDYDKALDMDIDVWASYAQVVVKRIRRNFEINGTGLAALKEIIDHDPLWLSVDLELLEDTSSSLVFQVRNCPALVAMEKIGREKLTCEPVEGAYLQALASAVDPEIKVKALKLPPRQSPDEICCRWVFYT